MNQHVTGFYDNRWDGPNQDYTLPLVIVDTDTTGWDLVPELIA